MTDIARKDWPSFFFDVARLVASRSRDPSTKCGAVIVRPDKTIAGVGFNGFPRGVVDTAERYANRDFKIATVVHAEENAILNASGPVRGCDLYVVPFSCCAHCASVIVQAGIARVFVEQDGEIPERWQANMAIAATILSEGGVTIRTEFVTRLRKPRVILESPYAGGTIENVAYARAALRDCVLKGEAPIASHLLFTQDGVLRDELPEERQLGMESGWAWTERADYVVVYEDRGISQGMHAGIRFAMDIGIPVIYRSLGGIVRDAA